MNKSLADKGLADKELADKEMTERSTEDLERELAFYRRQCNDLGARVLRMQEEQSRAHREARRSRTAARLLRSAFGLVNVEASDEAIGDRML